ncbi:MAG: FtsX-like permease family protein [Spirochaetes bacterium]|nr:FtsX-like permease family protein [Spirochaetota bacterium]
MSLYEFFIGFRYLKAKKSQGIVSFNTILSITIVFIGVFILIIVISVMNGFQSAIKDKILDVNPHIEVLNYYPLSRDKLIKNYNNLKNKIESVQGIKSVEPFIESLALFRYKDNISSVGIRGMGSEKNLPEDIAKFITERKKEFLLNNEVFIGSEMALNNNIKLGDKIEIFVAKGNLTARTGNQLGKNIFTVIGFFKTHYYEYDTSLIVMSLKSAQRLYGIGDNVSGVGAKVFDLYKMDYYARKIQAATDYQYQTRTAEEKNQNFFYALKLEKLIMIIILFLVIVSALFTIMGTLVMVVAEKRKAIGILKSMGAKPKSIMAIFVMEGFLIGLTGSCIGVVLGLAASINLESIIEWIEKAINSTMSFIYHLFSIGIYEKISLVPRHVYYLDSIPTEISPEFVVTITIITVFLSTVAAVFPSWHASRLQPIETIRYE